MSISNSGLSDTAGGALSVRDACTFLGGISRATLYLMMSRGLIPHLKVGGRRVILRAHLEAYLAEKLREQAAGPIGGVQ